jgi:hypothetical protein
MRRASSLEGMLTSDEGRREDVRLVSLTVFTTGILLLLALEVWGSAYARGGHYFQVHSSEDLMQTLSLLDLREHLWRSLLALHVQPPLLDTLRGLLARLWPDVGKRVLVLQVDRALYLLWAIAYAGIAVLVFRWLRRLLAGTRLALVAALAFLLHPGAIYYASYLDSTTLTALGVLALSYALWAMPSRKAIVALVACYLFLFLLRSIFQWPVLVVLVASLLLMRVPGRRILAFAAACGVVVGGYMLKQYLVFGWTGTSSFAGSNCLHALGEEPEIGLSTPAAVPLGPLFARARYLDYPSVLTRASKITGAHNFNNVADFDNDRRLVGRCVRKLTSQPLTETLRAYRINLGYYLRPSSRFFEQPHAIVDRLPWRAPYDWIFSSYRLLVLLAVATAAWAWGRRWPELLRGLGLVLPILLVFAVSVTLERGENMRFKYFVEPVLYVFVVSQLATLVRRTDRDAPLPAVRRAFESDEGCRGTQAERGSGL